MPTSVKYGGELVVFIFRTMIISGGVRWIKIIIIIGLFGACSEQKKYLDFRRVKNGEYLEMAQEIALDSFVPIWLNNTRHHKLDMNLNELYKDTLFTYFGKQAFKKQDLFKIKNNELKKLDYKALKGDSITSNFYNEIIPIHDRKKGEGKNCTWGYVNIDFNYKFIEAENIIEVRCHYKVTCEFIIRLVKSDYFARYDLKRRAFLKH